MIKPNEDNRNLILKSRSKFIFIAFIKILTLLVIFTGFIFRASEMSMEVPLMHLDGAYQTTSTLHRLISGELPGRDFYPYLGLGPLYSLFPLYFGLGGNVASAVFSSYVVLPLMMSISAALILHLVSGTKVLDSAFGGSLFFVAINSISKINPELIEWLASPGNSLRAIRSFLPFLTVIVIISIVRFPFFARSRVFIVGVILGCSVLWSNDFGLPNLLLGLITFTALSESPSRKYLARFANLLFGAVSGVFVFGQMATLGNLNALIGYNFVDVAGDQSWYFGPYHPDWRVSSFSDLPNLLNDLFSNYLGIVATATLTTLIVLVVLKRQQDHLLILHIGMVTFASGIIASIGGHVGGYFVAFYYWGALVATSLMFLIISRLFKGQNFQWEVYFIHMIVFIGFIACLTSTTSKIESLSAKKTDLLTGKYFFVQELGGFIPLKYKSFIEFARDNKEKTISEEYWSLLSAIQDKNQPWKVDSVIHALGRQRMLAQESLNNLPDLLVTTNPTFSPEWQPWNFSQNYWFYKRVIDSYQTVFETPTQVVWQRSEPSNVKYEPIKCEVSESGSYIVLSSNSTGLTEVSFKFTSTTTRSSVVRILNSISFGGAANGTVSIDPRSNTGTIPLIKESIGDYHVGSLLQGKTTLNFTSCAASKISNVPREAFIPRSFLITDRNWDKGVAKNFAGIFLPHTEPYISASKVGNSICLIDGSRRKITNTYSDDIYLNIFFEGLPIKSADITDPFNSLC